MADEERLFVLLEARISEFERKMVAAERRGTRTYSNLQRGSNVATRALESDMARAAARVNQALATTSSSIGGLSRAFAGPLAGIGAALSAREVMRYADAWTSAKNSLAVAGVVGKDQVDVLDRIYASAQRNATPLGALSDLYGKAAQASDNLGASQEELLRFSDGIALSLRVAGSSAEASSGALTQLGQLLGSARVQAEEFSSVNDGARPILIAVANGLDAAGGSVSRLKQLVNDGKVSGREFFQAFLKGLPTIAAMAENSTQTIDQGMTKIRNAFTRYIGQSDESLGASQRLVAGLNALADNFDQTADMALKFAGILAGALLGRGIGGMLATIPTAASAVTALVTAMRAGTLTAAGFTAALGPIGLIVGAAAGAALIFGDWSAAIDDATQSLADQAASGDGVIGMIADTERAQKAYEAAIAATANTQTSASNSIVADSRKEFQAKKSLLDLELKRQQALMAVKGAALSQAGNKLRADVGGAVAPSLGGLGDGGMQAAIAAGAIRTPDAVSGLDKTRAAIAASPATAEIQQLRAELDLAEVSAIKLGEALNTTFVEGGGGGGVKPGTSGKGTGSGGGGTGSGSGGGARADELAREVQQLAQRTEALRAGTAAQAALNPVVEDYGYATARAAAAQELLAAAQQAGLTVTPALRANIDALADGYARATVESNQLAESQEDLRQRSEEMRGLGKQVMGGFVSDLIAGKDAADALSGALGRVADRLLDMALTSAFGGTTGGGGSITALLGSMMGFASGTANTGGSRGEPRGIVHGQEAVIPLPRGGGVPVEISGAGGRAQAAQAVQVHATVEVVVGRDGNLQAYVREVSQREAGSAVTAGMSQMREVFADGVQRSVSDPRFKGAF